MNRVAPGTLVLLGLLAACSASRADVDSGVEGRVTIGPMCPVVQADVPCPDGPLSADLEVRDARGRVVARGRAADDGSYQIELPAGTYLLVPLSPGAAGIPFASPQPLSIEPGVWLTLDIHYDSGIR